MEQQDFIRSLFDFSFSNYVTPTIIRILYGIQIAIVALATLGLALMGIMGILSFNLNGLLTGLVTIVLVCPIYLALGIIASRIGCELLVLTFKVAENLARIEQNTRK